MKQVFKTNQKTLEKLENSKKKHFCALYHRNHNMPKILPVSQKVMKTPGGKLD